VAANWAPLSTVKLLQQYGVDYTKTDALHNAAEGSKAGRLEIMAYLIHEAGFPTNQLELEFLPDVYRLYACNGLGTALHSAVKEKCEETLKFLLENDADRDKADTNGRKPIDLARQNGFEAGVLLLQQ
jgi:ankyrin repeat protein